MAKRKKRGFFRKAARASRRGARRAGIGSTGNLIQIDAIAYGAIRPFVSNLIAPIASMIPAGQYADELGMGLANWFIAKKMGGMIGQVARKGLVVENAMVGSALGASFIGGTKPTATSTMFG